MISYRVLSAIKLVPSAFPEKVDRCFPTLQMMDVLAFFAAETISVLGYEMSPYLLWAGGLDTTEGAPRRNPVFFSNVAFKVLASSITFIAITVRAYLGTRPMVPWKLEHRHRVGNGVVELDVICLSEWKGRPLFGRVVRSGNGRQGISGILVLDTQSQQDCETFTAFPYLA